MYLWLNAKLVIIAYIIHIRPLILVKIHLNLKKNKRKVIPTLRDWALSKKEYNNILTSF